MARKLDASRTAASLSLARADLEKLSAEKDKEAAGAADLYRTLSDRLDKIARQAADFAALVARINALRQDGESEAGIVTVTAQKGGSKTRLTDYSGLSLLEPVIGTPVPQDPENKKNGNKGGESPGMTYATLPGAQVIAPADGKVLFAGPYHKEGQVLILEITTGYDVVLAGIGRVTVQLGDQLLAGEPVGIMPMQSGTDTGPLRRLYFELRQNGKGLDPEPWLTSVMRKAKKT
ncbi:MAG TPA: peptidoglycan DD-metalloendopeptidase family protein [Rhizomicrobium sp.]|nr:peptidoglycan DD-metalloendopeptidase family protein [Rhizomicrobium sp.]